MIDCIKNSFENCYITQTPDIALTNSTTSKSTENSIISNTSFTQALREEGFIINEDGTSSSPKTEKKPVEAKSEDKKDKEDKTKTATKQTKKVVSESADTTEEKVKDITGQNKGIFQKIKDFFS